jgi:hypothetical protein
MRLTVISEDEAEEFRWEQQAIKIGEAVIQNLELTKAKDRIGEPPMSRMGHSGDMSINIRVNTPKHLTIKPITNPSAPYKQIEFNQTSDISIGVTRHGTALVHASVDSRPFVGNLDDTEDTDLGPVYKTRKGQTEREAIEAAMNKIGKREARSVELSLNDPTIVDQFTEAIRPVFK